MSPLDKLKKWAEDTKLVCEDEDYPYVWCRYCGARYEESYPESFKHNARCFYVKLLEIIKEINGK